MSTLVYLRFHGSNAPDTPMCILLVQHPATLEIQDPIQMRRFPLGNCAHLLKQTLKLNNTDRPPHFHVSQARPTVYPAVNENLISE